MTNYTTGDNFGKAYVKARTLKSQIEALQAELKNETDFLSRAGSGKHTVTSPLLTGSFTVSENNTYSDDRMVTALKPGQFQRVSTRKLDRAKVKALYPNIYAASKTFVGFKVSL